MVRDEDAEDYTEHHRAEALEYRFEPKRGIPFPAFTAASADFPELRVEAEWERDGVRGRAVIANGQLLEQDRAEASAVMVDVSVSQDARLELGLTCADAADGGLVGYAVTDQRHTYFRYRDGALSLLDPDDAALEEPELEESAFRFVDEWIWYDEEEAALERVRYANYGHPVRGANLKAEKLALLRAHGGSFSTLDQDGKAVRKAIVEQWLKP